MSCEKPFQPFQEIRSRRVTIESQSLLGRRRHAEESPLHGLLHTPKRRLVLSDRLIHRRVDLEQAAEVIRSLEGVHDRIGELRRNAGLALDFTP